MTYTLCFLMILQCDYLSMVCGMLVLQKGTAPRSMSVCSSGAVLVAGCPRYLARPIVESKPSRLMQSLTLMGTPCKGPR